MVDPSQNAMTLEAARKVIWMKSNPKPIGELLDSGYLSKKDLEWAAANAYKAVHRQAAQIILDAQRDHPAPTAKELPIEEDAPQLKLPMTLAQARATIWTLNPSELKGKPMGELVDSHRLTMKDLGYAIENAWELRVRQAALVLMTVLLKQKVEEPTPSTGFLHVTTVARSFSQRRQFEYVMVEGIVMGIAFGILLTIWLSSVINSLQIPQERREVALLRLQESPSLVVAVIVASLLLIGAIVLFVFITNRIIKRLDQARHRHRKGERGEQRVVEIMQQTLDGQWHLFRNVVLPGRVETDLDGVLIGPSGIWVLEIKNFAGEHRNIADQWEYKAKSRWKKSSKNPSEQAKKNAAKLSNFLRADGIDQWIMPAIVWANPESLVSVENSSVAVWKVDRLREELGNIWQESKIAEEKRQKIVEELTKLQKKWLDDLDSEYA